MTHYVDNQGPDPGAKLNYLVICVFLEIITRTPSLNSGDRQVSNTAGPFEEKEPLLAKSSRNLCAAAFKQSESYL